jgi:hypothetical protein
MKKLLFSTIILIAFNCFIISNLSAQENNQQKKQLNRILIFTFRPGIVADSIKLVDNAYLEISKLPGIKSFKIGVEKQSEKEPESIKHIYMLGFSNEQAIESYTKTQQHKDLMKLAKTVVDYKIFDYWTENQFICYTLIPSKASC